MTSLLSSLLLGGYAFLYLKIALLLFSTEIQNCRFAQQFSDGDVKFCEVCIHWNYAVIPVEKLSVQPVKLFSTKLEIVETADFFHEAF